jgi:hypothetical protein
MSRSLQVTLRAACDSETFQDVSFNDAARSGVRPTLPSALRACPPPAPPTSARAALSSVCASFELLDAMIEAPVSPLLAGVLGDLHAALLRLSIAMTDDERDVPTQRAPGYPYVRLLANDESSFGGESS